MSGSVVLVGGPDSGKTNYIARLWPALEEGKGQLVMAVQPQDIDFVMEIADHLFQGHFIQRSEHTESRRDFEVAVAPRDGGGQTRMVIPDVSGELWTKAVTDLEVSADLMAELRRADGALLFVRVGSDQNVQPLDWVSSRRHMAKSGQAEEDGLSTQVMLCELIRFMEFTLSRRQDGSLPRLAVVVTAWDLIGPDIFDRGPAAYLANEYPLLAGRLEDLERLDARVFGLSVVGGDLREAVFRNRFLDAGLDGHGWVAVNDPAGVGWQKDPDMTVPLAWAIGA